MSEVMLYPVGLNDFFTFGKHKGESVGLVIEEDPSYIQWCLDEVKNFSLQPEAEDLFDMQDIEDHTFFDRDADETTYGYGGDLW